MKGNRRTPLEVGLKVSYIMVVKLSELWERFGKSALILTTHDLLRWLLAND